MQIKTNTELIDNLIEQKTMDRWTANDSERWVREFGELNPELKLPKVRAEYRESDRVK